MENFKLASQQKLRFQHSRGSLTVEQLWDLSIDELDALAVSLEDQHKQSGKKSFLTTKSVKDKTAKLRFDVVLEVLTAKVEEAELSAKSGQIKERNKKILAIIADKQDQSLSKKSVKELEAMLEE
jgi:hypothetical protein